MTIGFIVGFPGALVSGGTHASTSPAVNATGANTIVAFASAGPGNGGFFEFTDNLANTYSPPIILGVDLNGRLLAMAYALNATVSASMTVEVFSNLSCDLVIMGAAFAITQCSAITTSGALNLGISSAPASNFIGSTTSPAVIIGLFSGVSSAQVGTPNNTFIPGPGFTQSGYVVGDNGFGGVHANPSLFMEYEIVNTVAEYAATASMIPANKWAAFGFSLPDFSGVATYSSQATQGQNPGAPLPGIPANMSLLAAMSAGLVPANIQLTGGISPAPTLLSVLSNPGPAPPIAMTTPSPALLSTPTVQGG
jgi:hypothetical protein